MRSPSVRHSHAHRVASQCALVVVLLSSLLLLVACRTESEEIVYYESSSSGPRQITVHLPKAGDAPYPVVLVTTSVNHQSLPYESLVDALLSDGMAVAKLDNPGMGTDGFCAWSWLAANGADIRLNTDQAIVFSHGVGIAGTLPAMGDEALWDMMNEGCPSPTPERVHIAGVVTFGAWFMLPTGSLTDRAGQFAAEFGVGVDQIRTLTTQLEDIPPEAWLTSDQIAEEMRPIVKVLPLAYAHGPTPAEDMPAMLLLYGDGAGDPISNEESIAMAEALAAAGLSARAEQLTNASFSAVASSNTEVPQRVAEAVAEFAADLLAE